MKTSQSIRRITLLVMVIFFAAVSSFAAPPVKSSAATVQKILKEKICYPEQAVRNCCEGTVTVYFSVNDEGMINIKKTIAENSSVDKMVREQFKKICLKDLELPEYENYKITVTFKLI